MSFNSVQTNPRTFDMGEAESLILDVEFSPILRSGETVESATCTIARKDNEPVLQLDHLPEIPFLADARVYVRVEGIEETRVYLLRFTVVTNTQLIWSAVLQINGVNT